MSKLRWFGSYLCLDNLRISHEFFLDTPYRFSYITKKSFFFLGLKQDYMFISINKGTNIPISGKINFFMLNNKYFCNYNYYFKHFRKKSLKSKKAPFLKKKLKAVRRYIKFNPTTRRLKLRATSNHKPFIKFLVKNLKKRVVRRRSKRILSYI